MTKRNGNGKVDVDSNNAALGHNPFAALGALKATLPATGVSPMASPTKTATPSAREVAMTKKIIVRRERKGHGGKTVTLVQGMALPVDELERFARDLKKALGCGAVVHDGEIQLQGDIVDRVIKHLSQIGAQQVVNGG